MPFMSASTVESSSSMHEIDVGRGCLVKWSVTRVVYFSQSVALNRGRRGVGCRVSVRSSVVCTGRWSDPWLSSVVQDMIQSEMLLEIKTRSNVVHVSCGAE